MRNAAFAGILGLGLAAWLGWTYFTSGNLETPKYTVVDTRDGFEIRRYEPYIVAQVEVEGSYREAINQGFRKLAGYIFGGNEGSRSVKMTAPVTEREAEKIAMTVPVTEQKAEKIAMTAPVTETDDAGLRTVSFMMPSDYTLETLPVPDDPSVAFVEVPAKVVAVSRFSLYATGDRVARKKRDLVEMVGRGGLKAVSAPTFATYNDPFSFPLLMRHEVWLELEGGAEEMG